jgi:type IV pilus assembly protein PilB
MLRFAASACYGLDGTNRDLCVKSLWVIHESRNVRRRRPARLRSTRQAKAAAPDTGFARNHPEMCARGYAERRDFTVTAQPSRTIGATLAKRIGELLVEAAVISQSQLEQALFAQRKDGRKLGHLLIELGLVNEIQLTQTLSRQLSVPWVSLYHVDFSRSLLNLVTREIAERYSLVPIFVRRVRGQGETLYVAMDDPTNEAAIDDVARTAALPVKPMIACPSDIRAAIRVYYLGERASAPPAQTASAHSPRIVAAEPPLPKPAAPPIEAHRNRREPVTLEAVAPQPARSVPHDAQKDSADSAPDIEATEREITAPRRTRPKMISLTLLDGTRVSIPAPVKTPDSAEHAPRTHEELSDQLTARDLVSALRAVAHGADASEILGAEPRWEAMFSALLSVMLRKGLIADWDFIEEFRKI